ncbi:MAG TPA: PmoA family protein [Verrucomicrobiota bacterium]|nr:PmoA family protein [Verrucomicrobiota bacterium]
MAPGEVGTGSSMADRAGTDSRAAARDKTRGRLGFWAVVATMAMPVSLSAAGFRFADIDSQSLGLWEDDRPVLVYRHGVIAKPGVPADRARSTYLHPIYGLDGEVLTDDFPADHYHHRGLFWAWPHVTVDGQHYDLWALQGIRQEFVRWLARDANPTHAALGIENGWFVGDRKVMIEQAWIRILPASGDARAIDLDFTWTPLNRSVTLAGAEGKSYGGLTLRFAPGTNTVITVPAGPTLRDLPMTNLPWADLTRLWAREKLTSGAAIFVHPTHPDYPPEWLTRHYGVLCLGWPGIKPATFAPGQPIRCSYRVWIHRGSADIERLERAYESYRSMATRR